MTDDLHLDALHDAAAFVEEQRRLGQVWTLLGYASDIPRENDWFRTVLGGRSVFVQRFAEGLRGFENRCAHRSYPLRTTDRGVGPVICGFHNWRYDAEGNAVGIPNCPDSFSTTPGGLNRRLATLDVACCGDLIFARFPGLQESLAEFLGPIFDVLSELCASVAGGQRATLPGRMNWRLSQWISMDDYHLAAVHPKSLPAGKGYLRRSTLNYQRFGPHSAYFGGQDSGTIADWAGMLRAKQSPGPGYRIFHLFPNTGVAFLPAIPSRRKTRLPFS
jgi:phenylpropionate dioxygenase-like ring-hydroxylating dioxygenase large terminal subunit